jgi:hypothetical protein
MNADTVRKLATSLPDVTEEPHFHFTSFRIDGRIFATMPPSGVLLHVFVSEVDRELAVAAYPDVCEMLHWGKRLVGVKIDLKAAADDLVETLVRAAYDDKASHDAK